jgi:threonine/homoserine/homoserine lactone efflux protein
MKKVMATLLAVSILTTATNPAWAVFAVTPGKTFATGHAGFWVGSIAINAVSLIACAMIVSRQSHRELNAKEVFWASLVPMGCLLVPR